MNKFYFIVIFLIVLIPKASACSRDVLLLSPEIQIKFNQLEKAAEHENLGFILVCGKRSQKEQDELFAQGRTKPGKKVTWTRSSKHISGNAFDIVAIVDGRVSWDKKDYLRMGELGKQLGLHWGGDWKVRDYGHFELEGGNHG